MDKAKKFFPYLLILIFVGWFSYKFFIARPINQTPSMKLDWEDLDASSGSKITETPVTLRSKNPLIKKQPVREFSALSESDEAQFAEYDAMQAQWLLTAKGIMGMQHYQLYLEMRENNEKEKMQAYKEYHDYLRTKYGDKFNYNISEDQSIREKEINQKYLKQLLEKIGTEKFQTYLTARDKINEENRRNKKLFLQIEF